LNIFFPAISERIDLKFSKDLQVNLHCLFFLLSSSSESFLFPQNLNLFVFTRLNNLLGGGVVGDKSTPWTWALLMGSTPQGDPSPYRTHPTHPNIMLISFMPLIQFTPFTPLTLLDPLTPLTPLTPFTLLTPSTTKKHASHSFHFYISRHYHLLVAFNSILALLALTLFEPGF
jgi:hypothetical protein